MKLPKEYMLDRYNAFPQIKQMQQCKLYVRVHLEYDSLLMG